MRRAGSDRTHLKPHMPLRPLRLEPHLPECVSGLHVLADAGSDPHACVSKARVIGVYWGERLVHRAFNLRHGWKVSSGGSRVDPSPAELETLAERRQRLDALEVYGQLAALTRALPTPASDLAPSDCRPCAPSMCRPLTPSRAYRMPSYDPSAAELPVSSTAATPEPSLRRQPSSGAPIGGADNGGSYCFALLPEEYNYVDERVTYVRQRRDPNQIPRRWAFGIRTRSRGAGRS